MQTSWLSRRDGAAPRRLEELLERSAEPPGRAGWVPAEPAAPVHGVDHWSGRHRAPQPPGGPRRVVCAVVPSTVRQARWAVSWRAVLGVLLILLLLAVAVAALAAVDAPGSAVPQRPPSAALDGGPAGVDVGAPAAAMPVPASAPQAQTEVGPAEGGDLVVHVVGQVERPGVVRVPAGSRVGDALEAAGGATGAADVSRINLARLLVDGEQLLVPRPGEVLSPAPGPVLPAGAGPVGGGAAGSAGPAELLDLNTADLAALDGLDGIGPVLAQRILDWRNEHGRFTSVDELGEVTGIGDKLLEKLRAAVRV